MERPNLIAPLNAALVVAALDASRSPTR